MFGTRIQEAIKIGLAVTIGYGLAFYLGFEKPYWTPLTMVLISLDTTGQTLNKGLNRLAGNVVGAPIALGILAVAAQDRWLALALLSGVVLVCTFLYTGRRFGYAAFSVQIVSLIVVLEGYTLAPEDMFLLAAARVQETALGVVVFTLVSVLLWPRNSEPELRSAVLAVPRAQRDLLELAWSRDAAAEAVRARQLELSSLETAARANFEAAATESRTVADRRAAWAGLIDAQRSTQQALGRWIALRPETAAEDPTALLPELARVREYVDALLAAAEAQLAGAPPVEVPPVPEVRAEALDTTRLGALRTAEAAVFADALAEVARAARRQRDAAARLAGQPSAARAPSRSETPFAGLGDPERWRPALVAVVMLWVATVMWIYVQPPGGSVLVLLAVSLAIPLALLPQAPVALAAIPFALSFIICGLIFVFVLPRLSSFSELGLVIFAFFFLTRYIFYKPHQAVARIIFYNAFIVATGLNNQMSYQFESFLVSATMVGLVLILLQMAMNFPFQRRPEKLFVRMARRFFRDGARLLAVEVRRGEDAAVARLLPIAPKLRAVTQAIDFRALPEVPPTTAERLVASFDVIANRLQEVVRSRELPVTADFAERFAADGRAWQEGAADVLRAWAADPARPVPGLRARLDAESNALEQRVANFLAEGGTAAADFTTRLHMLRVVGAYRGVAQALVGHAELLERTDLTRWQEPRF